MTEQKQRRKPRKYTDEFKQQLVELYRSGKRRCDICREYDIATSLFDKWVKQASNSGSFHEKDAADLTDGRLGGRVTRKEIYETELPHRAVAVYLYLETRADRERTCYPAIGTIARELHLSVSTVKRAIHDLECAGFIQKKQRWRENGGKSSLLYEIIK